MNNLPRHNLLLRSMEHKTRGIIFHTIKYGESGLVVKIFTEHYGLQSFIVNSVRGKKSKIKAAVFQPLTLVDLIFQIKENRGLQRIKDIRAMPIYHSIHSDIVKSSLVLFLNEVLYKSIKEEGHADQPLFDFVFYALQILDLKTELLPNFHLYFMIQLSRLLGFFPHGECCDATPYFDLREGTFIASDIELLITLDATMSRLLFSFMNANFDTLNSLAMTSAQRKILLHKLLLFFELHLAAFKNLKTPFILEEILK